ncbi:MAG: energy transducer TonB [Gemmatimonadota bacterium]|nr:energy transducer TonB [Gemmatimonadota bacterium]
MHRSLAASVLMHAAILAGWPALSIPELAGGTAVGSGHMEVVSLGALPPPNAPRSLVPLAMAVADQEDEDEKGADGEADRPDPSDFDESAERAAAGRRGDGRVGLRRVASLQPRMTDPAPARENPAPTDSASAAEEPSDGEESEGLRIRRGTEDLEYQRLSDEEALRLEELSALRPELVLFSPSSWLVLRNPDEVGSFLRARFEQNDAGTEDGGSLSISLWVDERGSVEWAEINRSSGNGSLDASALELFRDVVAFRPARDRGRHTPVAAIFWLTW